MLKDFGVEKRSKNVGREVDIDVGVEEKVGKGGRRL